MRLFSFVFVALFFIGCEDSNVKRTNTELVIRSGVSYQVYEWYYKGHTYLVMGSGSGGYSMTHAGHCSCKGK